MKKLLVTLLVISMAFSFVMANDHVDHDMRRMPSFNILLKAGGNFMHMHGAPFATAMLFHGDDMRVIIRGLESDTYYSLHHDGDCLDLDKKTNRHGNLVVTLWDIFDYSQLYHMRDVPLGGDLPTLNDGVSEDFELFKFKCGASSHDTEDPVLEGLEPKHKLREKFP